jgi:transcriptional regulator with PAS, ATPase and Fis domain
MAIYVWPGNVRELQNVIERGIILAKGEITLDELPAQIVNCTAATQSGDGLLKLSETEMIRTALQKHRGNRRQTAEALGISLRTLQYRLKALGLA